MPTNRTSCGTDDSSAAAGGGPWRGTLGAWRRALAVFAVAAAASAARAESISTDVIALGWQTEHADVVAIVTVTGAVRDEEWGALAVEVRIEEPVRGTVGAGTAAVVMVPDDRRGLPWRQGVRHLAFLRAWPERDRDAAPRFAPVSGSFSLRRLTDDGPEARFPAIVRQIGATLDERGAVRDPAALRALLVTWMEDPDAGIAWSAATDFVRHRELHDTLTDEERTRIREAYRLRPAGKRTKAALAFAVASARPESAARALVDSLIEPQARLVRADVAEALRRLMDPQTTSLLLARLDSAQSAEAVEDLLSALGTIGGHAAADAVVARLADARPGVRVEAAHATGRIAQNVRAGDPLARIEARPNLLALLDAATTHNERRAALWALAQLDDADAWAALRRVASESTDADVRRIAAQYLARPRQSLLLD